MNRFDDDGWTPTPSPAAWRGRGRSPWPAILVSALAGLALLGVLDALLG